MKQIQRVALFAVSALILLYLGDYILARFHPQALGSVDVQIMWAIKQKDNRIDYELGDTETRPCVHSLFPQMGYAPCWYLIRHRNQTITVGSIPRRRLISRPMARGLQFADAASSRRGLVCRPAPERQRKAVFHLAAGYHPAPRSHSLALRT